MYEEYTQRQAWGIAHPSRFQDWDPLKYNMTDYFREGFLKGRELLGEPQDFDF